MASGAGLVLAGILASTMSTADSQLIAASSAVSENILRDTFKIKMSEKASMLTARLTLIVVAVLGVIIAWNPDSSVMKLVSDAWAGFGAAFGPVILLSLYWKRFSYAGALAGIIAGFAVDVIWLVCLSSTGIYEIIPGFIAGLLVAIVVTLITKKPSAEVEQLFDNACVKRED